MDRIATRLLRDEHPPQAIGHMNMIAGNSYFIGIA
jgi:hypothetical protein